MMMNIVPFGQCGDRLLAVEEVKMGLDCGCVCPSPYCGKPLVARQGDVKVWHFAHAGDKGTINCGGAESGLHKYAKQLIAESVGKVFTLPSPGNSDYYRRHLGQLKIDSSIPEYPIPGTSRRCDIRVDGTIRRAEPRSRYDKRATIGVEIAVTNYKDEEYRKEVRLADALSIVEVGLSWDSIRETSERLGYPYTETVRHCLFPTSRNKTWLFRKGAPTPFVCPECFKPKSPEWMKCYECMVIENGQVCPNCGNIRSPRYLLCYSCSGADQWPVEDDLPIEVLQNP